ncbi:MAG: RCC1 domain-containing protein [Gemmatimonadaceae bacterium]
MLRLTRGPAVLAVLAVLASLSAGVLAGCDNSAAPVQWNFTLSHVSPSNGQMAGGKLLRLVGTNFPNRIDSVRVGSQRLSGVTRKEASAIDGIVPGVSEPGIHDVTLYTSAGDTTCRGCYRYNPPVTWRSIVAGGSHSCSLESRGFAYCWGDNTIGQLGQESWPGGPDWCDEPNEYFNLTLLNCSGAPLAVAGGIPFESLSAGSSHTCGLVISGQTYCWGHNGYGQLGDGSNNDRRAPVRVGPPTFSSLNSGRFHTCGLTNEGAAYCWGSNFEFALGNGSSVDRNTPGQVAGGLVFVSLAAGDSFTCGLTSLGAAYCWGSNRDGQLGDQSTRNRGAPGLVLGDVKYVSIIAGAYHACGLTTAGAAYCWGMNGYGQLGDGSTTNRGIPVATGGSHTFIQLTAGAYHTCGLQSAGTVLCWGGWIGRYVTPVPVSGGPLFASIHGGGFHTCGLGVDNSAWCWGENNRHQLGDGSRVAHYQAVAVQKP